MILTEPLRLTEHRRGLRRRRHHRTVAAPPARPAPCASASPGRSSTLDPELRAAAQEGRLPHPRPAQEGDQEVRPQEGPQGAAVLQALIRPAAAACRSRSAPTASAADADAELHRRRSSRVPRAAPRRRCSAPTRFVVGRDTRALRAHARGRPRRRAWPADGRRRSTCSASCPPRRWRWLAGRRRHRRRGDLGLAQPVVRQRHQVLRARRAQARPTTTEARASRRELDRMPAPARRRARRRRRARSPPAPDLVGDLDRQSPRSTGRRPRRPARGARLRQRRGVARSRPTCSARSAPTVEVLARRARRPQHQRGLRLHPPRDAPGDGRAGRRGRRRPGLRRRRRPGARRRRAAATLVDGDQIIAHLRHRPARPGRAAPTTPSSSPS